jgi:hypothetical protein
MNDRQTVETMSKVAQKIASAKKILSDALSESHPNKYMEIRELLNDCQEIMAIHCDVAPIRLITGQIEEILIN